MSMIASPARDTAASAAATNDCPTGSRRNSAVWLRNTRRATSMMHSVPPVRVDDNADDNLTPAAPCEAGSRRRSSSGWTACAFLRVKRSQVCILSSRRLQKARVGLQVIPSSGFLHGDDHAADRLCGFVNDLWIICGHRAGSQGHLAPRHDTLRLYPARVLIKVVEVAGPNSLVTRLWSCGEALRQRRSQSFFHQIGNCSPTIAVAPRNRAGSVEDSATSMEQLPEPVMARSSLHVGRWPRSPSVHREARSVPPPQCARSGCSAPPAPP